jgi:outer membrane protein insertion porin family
MPLTNRGRKDQQGRSVWTVLQKTEGSRFLRQFLAFALVLLFSLAAAAQTNFENRRIDNVEISFDGGEQNASTAEQLRLTAADALGTTYSAVRVRDSLAALHNTKRIVSAIVEATANGAEGVNLHYTVKLQTQAQKVTVEVGNTVGDEVTEQELLFKLNLLDPGAAVNEQTLKNNADIILEYLRDRGFFKSSVKYTLTPLEHQTDVGVRFDVAPNEQAHVESFTINVQGFDNAKLQNVVKLKAGELYSRDKLNKDLDSIKNTLHAADFLAPELDEPRVVYDSDKNAIAIELTGKVGPTVKVTVDAGKSEKVGQTTQKNLLPVKRDGTLDYAAIVEGERRLENFFQERGYFFADVKPICSVEPPFAEGEASSIDNNTEFLCSALGSADLTNRKVDLTYKADLNRKLTLTDIRITGTDKLTIDDVRSVLESQTANILSFIPLFGYGRGYTSERILETDANTIRGIMRELGYRDAQVRVNQGVSTTGDNLIITFVIDEGQPTVVDTVDVAGNIEIPKDELLAQISTLAGKNYSRARIRNAERKLSEFYSQRGYYYARITSSIIEPTVASNTGEKLIKVQFNVENEGKKVVIDRVLVTGNQKTKTQAIVKAVTLHPNDFLRAGDIYTSEQNLYSSDAFSRVEIKPQPAGTRPDGSQSTDVIVSVEEQAPRVMSYGGGYSTDIGLNGFFDIRHYNFLGNLWQAGSRISWSQRQQLVQFDFINPRFMPDGKDHFAPLTLTAQYQRDSTVTRFFRSAFDKGTFGIVQRIDENGNPIDDFGNKAGDPTINRLTFTAETNRTINRKQRSILFVRYRFEDVRLFNFESLLVKDLLRPDAKIRISGFGATFVRDTRENCSVKYSLLELIEKGEPGDRCRYNATDPTRGDYFTAEYNVSLPAIGANIGFNKFQASYNLYYTFPQLHNTTFATRAVLGVANVFSKGNRFSSAQLPGLDGLLPISERFFAGGPYTLRGFAFEEAGPRVVVVPQGTFRNSKGETVTLDPFTVPFGGNALAVVNLEARIPLTKSLRAVPFYDGGNVFRRVGDIFNPPDVPANDVFQQNLRALWTHTVGLGFRLKTPIGGEFGIDYGFLLNPPEFLIPQGNGPNAIYRLHQNQIHFRFSQAF